MRSSITSRKFVAKLLAAAFWLAVWQFAATRISSVLFVGPVETAVRLYELSVTTAFWRTIVSSLGRIALGLCAGLLIGGSAAVCAHFSRMLRALLEPVLAVMKSVPVACVVVVALIWMRSPWIAALVSCFVTAPVVYAGLCSGFDSLDQNLHEAFLLYRVPFARKLRYYYLPGLSPSLYACCRSCIGMAWKAGVAGEIIGLPDYSIGEQIYLAKNYLNIADLFAWTIVILAISALCERLIVYGLRRLEGRNRHAD